MGIQVFPNFYVKISKFMINKCVVTDYSTRYKSGQKKALFHFHKDQDLK